MDPTKVPYGIVKIYPRGQEAFLFGFVVLAVNGIDYTGFMWSESNNLQTCRFLLPK